MVPKLSQPKRLDTFRQQLNEALDQDFDVRKTALHTLIRKIEVDEDGQLDFDFYLASDVLASTPTAVQTPATSAYSYIQRGNTLQLESKAKAAQPIHAGLN